MRLNIDLGELDAEPEELWALAHLANIACGGHAGDDASMARALERCARLGAAPGAHPSYPDREHFGRVKVEMPPEALRASIAEQCARLARFRVPLGHAKPHGALYHSADRDATIASAVVSGIRDALGSVAIVGPAGGHLQATATAAGMPYLVEVFADRGTRPDGSLIPRGEPGALVTEPAIAAQNARRFVAEGRAATICVHGDTPGAVAIARAVRAVLDG